MLSENGKKYLISFISDKESWINAFILKIKNECEKDYLWNISDNVYRVKSYENNFSMLFDTLTPIDMIEGLVLKRKNARLEMGNTELNNTKSQVKARKATLNYKF